MKQEELPGRRAWFLCQFGRSVSPYLVQNVCGEDWRVAAIFLHAAAQQDTLRDGYVSLLALQSSIGISLKKVPLAYDHTLTKYRVTRATTSALHPAPHSGVNTNTKTIQGVISRFAKEEADMRRAIAHGMSLFRQPGGNTRRVQCVLGPLATLDARKLFMRCARCRARTAAGFRQRLAKSSISL